MAWTFGDVANGGLPAKRVTEIISAFDKATSRKTEKGRLQIGEQSGQVRTHAVGPVSPGIRGKQRYHIQPEGPRRRSNNTQASLRIRGVASQRHGEALPIRCQTRNSSRGVYFPPGAFQAGL